MTLADLFVMGRVNVLKFRTLFLFCSQIKHWFPEMLVRKVTSEDCDQTASSEAV